ncbi:MAG: hypothetical protein AB7I72_23850 [Parvibaculaceae bacterium]
MEGRRQMDARAELILTRAKELLARDEPGTKWAGAAGRPDERTIKRQGRYLSQAEHQLLDEGRIESVDQS